MRAIAIILGAILLSLPAGALLAAPQSDAPAEEAETIGRTPPRLSYLDGQVSFWRPGAEEWVQAQVNTALAPGDHLYIQGAGNFELQVGGRAFVRGGDDAQIQLAAQEPDFLHFKVTNGRVSLDLRNLSPGHTVEVDTPHAAFTIEHQGYYRLDVTEGHTSFITRRAGRATAVAAGGEAVPVEANEAVVIQAPSEETFAFQAAPGLDDWDRWNYARTDDYLAARSQRYVSPETYGAGDLDRYGSWRVLPDYGPVWVPGGVVPGWAPYTTGSWMYDPYYGWTWVDTAPWGWAPYHYGRWVYAQSFWCWAPGPVVARSYYAPALVAFFGGPSVSVGISIGGPGVGWVALGWGEPLVPWWGRPGFIHRPWWGGWGGPRCINNRVIDHRMVVTVNDIHSYRNSRVHNAMVAVGKDHFGHGRIRPDQRRHINTGDWRPIHQAPDIRPSAQSYMPSTRPGSRPPERTWKRSVVTFDPHARAKTIPIREPRDGFRTKAQPSQESRWAPQPDRPGTIQAPKDSSPAAGRPAPVRHRQTEHRDGGYSPARQPAKSPAVARPTPAPSSRSASDSVAGKGPAHPPKSSTGLWNQAVRVHPPKTADAPSPDQGPVSANGRRIEASRPGPPAAVPRSNAGNQLQRSPAHPGPAVRPTDRQPPQPEVGSPGRIVPAPGPARRSEPSRQTDRDELDNSGNRNSRTWQQPERQGRPEMNRGYDPKPRQGGVGRFRD